MINLYGHKKIRAKLDQDFPTALIFRGPESVGKWTTAEHYREKHGYLESDVIRVHKLSASLAREVREFMQTAPVGSQRLAIVRIDNAPPSTMDVLLKAVEEASAQFRFIFITTGAVPPTLLSRLNVYQFGYLKVQDIQRVLIDKKNFKPDSALRAAEGGRGSVQGALQASDPDNLKQHAVKAVEAIMSKDEDKLDGLAAHWSDADTNSLSLWCREALTKQWKFFQPEDVDSPRRDIPLKILLALRSEVRPKLVVRSSLQRVLRGA